MFLKSVICDVILASLAFSGILAQFVFNDRERFSKVRNLVSNKNDLFPYQQKTFQWDLTSVQETPATGAQKNNVDASGNITPIRKRRRKRLNSLTLQESMELANTTEKTTVNLFPQKTKNRRRKKLRKHRKQKNGNPKPSIILEVATNQTSNTSLISNVYLDELIKKLNENPEGKFNNLDGNILLHNKDHPAQSNLGENATKSINLTVDMGNENSRNNKRKHKKRPKTRCRFNNGGCSQICRSTGPEKCSCLKGYILDKDKHTCIDIDECKYSNGGCESICENKFGSYECKCNVGYRLGDDGKSCDDINECILRNGHGPCEDICLNTRGSYHCECRNGTNLAPDKQSCVDIDECAEGKSGCSHNCINTRGRAFCACPEGLELSEDWKTCRGITQT